jgi:hypothetical protein
MNHGTSIARAVYSGASLRYVFPTLLTMEVSLSQTLASKRRADMNSLLHNAL